MNTIEKRALIKTLERQLDRVYESEPTQANMRKAAVIFSKIERLKGARR